MLFSRTPAFLQARNSAKMFQFYFAPDRATRPTTGTGGNRPSTLTLADSAKVEITSYVADLREITRPDWPIRRTIRTFIEEGAYPCADCGRPITPDLEAGRRGKREPLCETCADPDRGLDA